MPRAGSGALGACSCCQWFTLELLAPPLSPDPSPRSHGERGIGGESFSRFVEDLSHRLDDELRIGDQVPILQSNHRDPLRSQPCIAGCIRSVSFFSEMGFTIELEGYTDFRTVKVEHRSADSMLPSKLVSGDALSPDDRPCKLLRIRHRLSHPAGYASSELSRLMLHKRIVPRRRLEGRLSLSPCERGEGGVRVRSDVQGLPGLRAPGEGR